MAGRPRKIRSIQSYINHSDTHSGLGMLKEGTAPKIGVTRNFWNTYSTESTPGPNSYVNTPAYYSSLRWRDYRSSLSGPPKL